MNDNKSESINQSIDQFTVRHSDCMNIGLIQIKTNNIMQLTAIPSGLYRLHGAI